MLVLLRVVITTVLLEIATLDLKRSGFDLMFFPSGVVNVVVLHLLLDVLAEYLVVLCERADKDDGGDLAGEVPLGPLHPLAAHVEDAEPGLAILEVKRLDGPRGVAHLEDVLCRPARVQRGKLGRRAPLARPSVASAPLRMHAQ